MAFIYEFQSKNMRGVEEQKINHIQLPNFRLLFSAWKLKYSLRVGGRGIEKSKVYPNNAIMLQ
jgi:hypothetical protein